MTPKEIWLSLLLALLLIICVQAGGMGNSREDDMEFDKQLKLLHKKPIKSIQGENDNIIDCVEIDKQPAFDHPLLKDHKVQMRPTSLPQETLKTQTLETGNLRFRRIGCPKGTVPIQRASRKQLAWMKHEFSASMNSSLANRFYEKPTPSGYLFSRMVTNKRRILFGAQARVNIRAPNVSTGQLSTSTIWVQNKLSPELNSIQIGWMVNPELFGDNIPHLYGYWTADSFKKTGCYNMLCSGFVQVDADIYLGLPLYVPPHSEGVLQPVLDLLLSKDPKTESWWLVVTIKAGVSVSVGYWPSSIFSSMAHLATEIGIGGKIYNKGDKPAPQMGSGYYVTGDRSKTSYISRINILDESNKLVELKDTDLVIDADNPNCYPVKYFNKYNSVLFGGPIAPYC